jgi:UDP-glucose 4-epimerase
MKILVTGGAGYIGSHTVVELVASGHEPVILDNFSNSKAEVLERLRQLTGIEIPFYEADVTDREALDKIMAEGEFDGAIHFAGFKSVGESIAHPERYQANNVVGTRVLAEAMMAHSINRLVFSSSATVYDASAPSPLPESSPLGPINPYGQSKLDGERLLSEIAQSHPDLRLTLLRYFNPVSAHPSGLIGEDPNGIPANLMPYLSQVAIGRLPELQVFGHDYPTPDGTTIRDYIHVVDLAKAHIRALEAQTPSVQIYNIGTGRGHSVLDLIHAFERATGEPIPYSFKDRRAGDAASYYGDPSKAEAELGWKAELDLDAMCRDALNWQSKNPNGYSAE